MGPVDIAVIVIVGVAVIGVATYLVWRKVKHKGGCCDCGCNCSSCSACGGCKHAEDSSENKND